MSFHPSGMSDNSDDSFDDFDYQTNNVHADEKSQNNYNYPDKDEKKQASIIKEENRLKEEERNRQEEVLTACRSGDTDTIKEYLDSGHNIDTYLCNGWTLLLYVSFSVKPNMIEFLLNLGANANKHKEGYTPLMAVCDSNEGTTEETLKCISLLLEAKADPDITNKDRRTVLMCACKLKESDVVLELLKHVKNIETRDKDGRSAVFYAVTGNKPENLKVLMKNKASVSVVDRRNLTVKEIALTKNYEKILQLIDFKDEEMDNFCPIFEIRTWKDSLASINHSDPDTIDPEIANMLFAMNLEKHRHMFKGMNLKTFLQLSDEKLINMGIDLESDRKLFSVGLRKFHAGKWKPQSIRVAKKSSNHTLFDGVAAIINITRQIAVIGASFSYIRKNLINDDGSGIILDKNERETIKKELEATEKILALLKKDLHRTLKFSEKIQKNSKIMLPPAYIGPKGSNKTISWTMIMTFAISTGFLVSRSSILQRLWN